MSKGSKRRPAAISYDEFGRRFEAIDWGPKPAEEKHNEKSDAIVGYIVTGRLRRVALRES